MAKVTGAQKAAQDQKNRNEKLAGIQGKFGAKQPKLSALQRNQAKQGVTNASKATAARAGLLQPAANQGAKALKAAVRAEKGKQPT